MFVYELVLTTAVLQSTGTLSLLFFFFKSTLVKFSAFKYRVNSLNLVFTHANKVKDQI